MTRPRCHEREGGGLALCPRAARMRESVQGLLWQASESHGRAERIARDCARTLLRAFELHVNLCVAGRSTRRVDATERRLCWIVARGIGVGLARGVCARVRAAARAIAARMRGRR